MAKTQRARKLHGAAAAAGRGVAASVLSVIAKAGGDMSEARRIAQELIDVLPVPVFIKSRDGRYLGVNRAWEEFFGIARGKFIGKEVHDLFPSAPWVAAEHQAMDAELWKKPGSQSYEIKITTRLGGPRTTIYHKATFDGPDGKVAGLIGTIIDVTGRKRAKRALKESEERFRQTFELAASGIAHVDLQGRFARVNRSLCRILGYEAAELVGKTVKEVSHPDDRKVTDEERKRMRSGDRDSVHFEKRYLRKDGETVWVDLTVALVRDAESRPLYEIAVFDDITERKNADAALRESEARFRSLTTLSSDWYWEQDDELRFTFFSPGFELRSRTTPRQLLGKRRWEEPGRVPLNGSWDDHIATLKARKPFRDFECSRIGVDGKRHVSSISGVPVYDASGKFIGYRGVSTNITDRKNAEEALRQQTERLQIGQQAARMIILDRDIVNDRLTWSDSPEWIRGPLPASGEYPLFKDQIHPEDRERFLAARADAIDTLQGHSLEYRIVRTDGEVVWVMARQKVFADASGKAVRMLVALFDITDRKRAEYALRAAHDELARSNAELEQFAYVASHDLQEPLRMVSSYTQLLGKRYAERLDGDAKEFMAFIVDGAARMKQLIEDLLAYSRVGTRGREFRPVSLEAVLRRATANLRAALEESGAAVTSDLLPEVEADESQLVQLLQNLIGNAVKFRGGQTPRIHVSCSPKDGEWEVAVQDNGIGIEPQYFERIFMVFQRLHDKGQYPGTGIGLAICKKVVDRHGGRLWVESKPGEGSRFVFTLPKKRGNNHG